MEYHENDLEILSLFQLEVILIQFLIEEIDIVGQLVKQSVAHV